MKAKTFNIGPLAGLDIIRLNGLQAEGKHGVYDSEHENGQLFIVDVDMFTNTRTAGDTGQLVDTIDYSQVADTVRDIVTSTENNLVEQLANDIAAAVEKYTGVVAVRVCVHKPHAPMDMPYDDVSVTVWRGKALAKYDPDNSVVDGDAPEVTRTQATNAMAGIDNTIDMTPTEPVRAVVALGANMDNPVATMRAALKELASVDGIGIEEVGCLLQTKAVTADDEPQPDYFNSVVVIHCGLSPRDLLHQCQRIEKKFGRRRTKKWGPRTIDLDIIAYTDVLSDDPELTLPHPRAHERAFVLVPWFYAEPAAELPGYGAISKLVDQAPDKDGIVNQWLHWYGKRADKSIPEPSTGTGALPLPKWQTVTPRHRRRRMRIIDDPESIEPVHTGPIKQVSPAQSVGSRIMDAVARATGFGASAKSTDSATAPDATPDSDHPSDDPSATGRTRDVGQLPPPPSKSTPKAARETSAPTPDDTRTQATQQVVPSQGQPSNSHRTHTTPPDDIVAARQDYLEATQRQADKTTNAIDDSDEDGHPDQATVATTGGDDAHEGDLPPRAPSPQAATAMPPHADEGAPVAGDSFDNIYQPATDDKPGVWSRFVAWLTGKEPQDATADNEPPVEDTLSDVSFPPVRDTAEQPAVADSQPPQVDDAPATDAEAAGTEQADAEQAGTEPTDDAPDTQIVEVDVTELHETVTADMDADAQADEAAEPPTESVAEPPADPAAQPSGQPSTQPSDQSPEEPEPSAQTQPITALTGQQAGPEVEGNDDFTAPIAAPPPPPVKRKTIFNSPKLNQSGDDIKQAQRVAAQVGNVKSQVIRPATTGSIPVVKNVTDNDDETT